MSLGIYLSLPACQHCGRGENEVWTRSPTYNLSPMWRAAGVPFDDIVNGMLGRDLLERLQSSLLALRRDPERFRAMDPPNKWGSYDGLCDVVQSMIDAIEKYPNAVVTTWR